MSFAFGICYILLNEAGGAAFVFTTVTIIMASIRQEAGTAFLSILC